MNNSQNKLSKIFFNSVEDMNECYGIDAEMPSNLYSNTDLVCYEIVEPFICDYIGQYVFTKAGCHHLNDLGEPVIHSPNRVSLELGVYEKDMFEYEGRRFFYVRVNEYLRKHIEKTLLGCEFVHKYDGTFSSERRFISSIYSKSLVVDQDGVFSSLDNILLYPDDCSDPIPYQEWIKQVNKLDVEVED